mgnify:CR=1 FL=1
MRYLYILLALVYITQSHAQTSNIVGQVINKDSVAIEGVAIILQKQDSTFIAGTITDKEGRFTLPKALSVDVPTSGIRSYVLELI